MHDSAAEAPDELRILHLSDLHLGNESARFLDPKIRLDSKAPRYADIAFDALETWPDKLPPDVIVVSGDSTIKGREDGLIELADRLEKLRKTLPGATPERIVVVPGNHDVLWERDGKLAAAKRYESFQKYTRTFTTPWLDEVHAPEAEHRPYFFSSERGLLVYALDSTTLSGRLAEQSDDQRAWLAEIKGAFAKNKKVRGRPARDELDTFVRSLSLHDGAAIGSGQLRVMSRNLESLKKQHGEAFKRAFKVAVLHHHICTITTAAIEMKTFELIVDAAVLKRALVEFGFELVLHGHKHVPHLTRDDSAQEPAHFTSDSRTLYVLCGGTVGGAAQSGAEHAFNWITVAPPNGGRRVICIRKCQIAGSAIAKPSSVWSEARITSITRRESPLAQTQTLHDKIDSIVASSAQHGAEKMIGELEKLLGPLMPGALAPLHMPEEFQDLVDKLRKAMAAKGNRFYATDVLGPSLWLQPESNTYFSIQVRPYLEANRRDSPLIVSSYLASALKRAIENHRNLVPPKAEGGANLAMDDVETVFHSLDAVQVGEPSLELVRILIWPTDQLKTPAAESIIRLHEGFSIPLFFLSSDDPSLGFGSWRNRTVDYCLKCDDHRLEYGFYGYSDQRGRHEVSEGQDAPISVLTRAAPYRTLRDEFLALLNHPKLLLASDARMLRRRGWLVDTYYRAAGA
jgi:3',5'-cyclic AMP phosphodiesterase CpdA